MNGSIYACYKLIKITLFEFYGLDTFLGDFYCFVMQFY
jgi:hypothetical protein